MREKLQSPEGLGGSLRNKSSEAIK